MDRFPNILNDIFGYTIQTIYGSLVDALEVELMAYILHQVKLLHFTIFIRGRRLK